MVKKLIFAGSYKEYLCYLKETGENKEESRYLAKSEDLMGRRGVKIVKYGTYLTRDNILLKVRERTDKNIII